MDRKTYANHLPCVNYEIEEVVCCDVQGSNDDIKAEKYNISSSGPVITHVYILNSNAGKVGSFTPVHKGIAGPRNKMEIKKRQETECVKSICNTSSGRIDKVRKYAQQLNMHKVDKNHIKLLENELKMKDAIILRQHEQIKSLENDLGGGHQIVSDVEMSSIQTLQEETEKADSELRLTQHKVDALEFGAINHNASNVSVGNDTAYSINKTVELVDSKNFALVKSSSGNVPEWTRNMQKMVISSSINKGENTEELFCIYCKKVFIHKSKLISHLRSHTHERPFECLVCGMSYKYKDNLMNHLLGKHCKGYGMQYMDSRLRFTCIFCDTFFHEKSLCRSHILKCHPNLIVNYN